MPMLKVEELKKSFLTEEVETIALDGVSFEVEEGEFVAVMGPSGCGKSTLLNILGLLDNPTGGKYFLLDREVGNLRERDRTKFRRGHIGFVFQSFNLIDELNVFENVELPLIYLDVKPSERKKRVNAILERMDITHRAAHFPQQLSGGQQQRVAIARALVSNPKLILADEPTGNLDSKNGQEVMTLLQELNREGTTVIMVTHSQHDATFAGRTLGLFDGRVNLTADGYYSITRALLFEQPTQSFTGFTHFWNNIGRVRNSGLELQLDTYNIEHKNFTWETNINFSFNRNRLLEIGGEREVISQGERSENYIARVGEPLIQYYGFKTIGVWNSLEEIQTNPHFSNDVPGGLRIWDANGDGVLNDDDRVALGDPYPDFSYGMTNTFRIGKLDISFLIQGVQGVTVFNGDVYYNETHRYNRAYLENRWVSPSHPGDGKTPYGKNGYDILLTDYPLQDGSYVCLRNATVGYTFSKKDLNNKLNGLRIYLSGNNLAYIWSKDYKGINPESRMTSGAYDTPMIDGYQRGGFPLTSTVILGIDFKF